VKSGRQKGGQDVSQGVNNHVRCMLGAGAEGKYRNCLGEGIDGQPQPENLCGAALPGAQFVQLEVREPEMAEGALVQALSVRVLAG
jgi:hypothetical protein